MSDDREGIVVTGEGRAEGEPDVAHVTVGVESSSPSIEEARGATARGMSRVLDRLKGLGIEGRDIYTNRYYIDRDHKQKLYRIVNSVRVTVRDLGKAGEVLDQAIAAGANSSYGIGFDILDRTHLEEQARREAVQDAQRKADQLAALMGVELGSPVYITEELGAGVSFGRATGLRLMEESTPIESGEMAVSLSVTVRYGIR